MKEQSRWRSIILSGAGYGGGLAAGSLLAYFLLNNQVIRFLLSWLNSLQLFLYLIFGLALLVIFIGLGGGIGGAIGGWVLSGVNDLGDRRRFAWRSGLSFFLAHALLLLPFVLVTAVIGFLNQNLDVEFTRLPALFAGYGLIYGAVAGLCLGLLTVGLRQMLSIFLASLFGFGLGGWLMGAGLYFYSQLDSPNRLLSFLFAALILFLFGAAGGGALGFAAQYVHDTRSLFPQTRGWRIFRNVTLAAITLYFLLAAGRLVTTLTIRPADLAETLPLPTVGAHWLPEDSATEAVLNPGPLPELFVDGSGRAVQAACDQSGQITLTVGGAGSIEFTTPRCHGEPVLAVDGDGRTHVVWYSDEATKVTGAQVGGHFLYESIGGESDWSEPAIIARPSGEVQPALSTMADGSLRLLWDEPDFQDSLVYVPYNCDDVPLTELGDIMYAAVRQEKYRPASDPIPYCQNQYDRLLFTPNPTDPDTDLPISEYGAFDQVAALVIEAEYEVLFTTMQWDKPSDFGSPGLTLTDAVAELYEKVKANPEAYPRGMTVRIMLGNVPQMAVFEATSQMVSLLQDLHDAGIDEMVDEEIGWKLEVADFGGAWPHAHSKFVVIDGKTAVASGFNYSYLHLSKDHPSGLGLDMSDLGIQITGPLAQTVLAAHDDLWSGSDLYTCSKFPPPLPSLWFLWCDESVAEASHTPEVLRFYATEGNSNAFALHHTSAFLESDEAIVDVLLAAQETIDLYEVNFSLDLICIISGLLGGLCDTEELAPPYMQALLAAMVENDVKVRVLAETSAMNGMENRIAINWLLDELEKEGKRDLIEFKFYDGKMHDKGLLIDEQLLIIGSQNFHWSAWDKPSLTEYNIATEDPAAIFDFLQDYEYQWDRGTPAAEAMVQQ